MYDNAVSVTVAADSGRVVYVGGSSFDDFYQNLLGFMEGSLEDTDAVLEDARALLLPVSAGQKPARQEAADTPAPDTPARAADEFEEAKAALEETFDTTPVTLLDRINIARTSAELNSLWMNNQAEWSTEHTQAAAARKAALAA